MSSHELSELIDFVHRDEWQSGMRLVMDEHFGPVLDELDLDVDDVSEMLGEDMVSTLWGCAFEDFLTREGDDGSNLVDAYLKHSGMRENAETKTYMRALRMSFMSIYEVSEIVPGKSLLARNMLTDGEPVLVSETTATKTLRQWDRIAARIVPVDGRNILAGGLLPFSHEASEMVMDALQDAVGRKRRARKSFTLGPDTLRVAAPLFTNVWLMEALQEMLEPTIPDLRNSDGEEIEFYDIRFRLAKGVRQKDIIAILKTMPAFEPASSRFWNWLDLDRAGSPPRAKEVGTLSWDVTMADGVPVLGNLELQGRELILSVNSVSRAENGTTLLLAALGARVGEPDISIRSFEELLEMHDSGVTAPRPAIDPAEEERLVHDMLDRQYRSFLDEPVGMLENVSPRAAVATEAGRKRVAQWLKYLENASQAHDPVDPMGSYDFGWLWHELGVAHLRR
ncbi:hypothetical protein GRZ55_21415 [Chelativorans sp. ZYF759]|uniref:hypothetical protein n=1 Tax=Chelativorans sp. ZYF759 TaxID=2692213 RepID=UPI00145E2094|nr:hypothetical protein [Chelativorans sp. ZYF759]NMG41798.1 hypothetical protein [Chelativorans sp. ZYF759]